MKALTLKATEQLDFLDKEPLNPINRTSASVLNTIFMINKITGFCRCYCNPVVLLILLIVFKTLHKMPVLQLSWPSTRLSWPSTEPSWPSTRLSWPTTKQTFETNI
jgi:hypothetical protein